MDRLSALVSDSATLLGALGAAVAALLLFRWATRLLLICPPSEVLILSGRTHKLPDGRTRGFRVIFGGRGWRLPILERASWMSLTVVETPISIRNAYSKGGIPMNIDAIANIKVADDPALIGNAIERFLGRTQEIGRVAKETLEGHLRGVLSTLTPEEVNQDRLKFAESLARESAEDFRKLGLQLDTFKIQNVSDPVGYLDSIGREAIANVLRDAEVAESDARRAAALVEAECAGRASVTEANVDAAIVKMENELRRVKAELAAEVRVEQERTRAAAQQARAEAEQELQRLRVQLEELRLGVDEVLPADAERRRRELQARGEAAAIRERGRAVGEALDALHDAWAGAGDAALGISLIERLDGMLSVAAKGVKRVGIERLRLIDAGDGQVLSSYVAAYPAMIQAVFRAVAETTGIDVPATISGVKAERAGSREPPEATSPPAAGGAP